MKRLAFITLCCGDLMIVLDPTIVNVALPSMASGLVNTAFVMGGGLGLAIPASVAAGRTAPGGGGARLAPSPRRGEGRG